MSSTRSGTRALSGPGLCWSQPCQFRSISIWRGPAVFPDPAQMAAHRDLEKPPPGPPTRLPFGPFPRQRSGGLLEVRFHPSWLDRRIQPERVCLSDHRAAMQRSPRWNQVNSGSGSAIRFSSSSGSFSPSGFSGF